MEDIEKSNKGCMVLEGDHIVFLISGGAKKI